MCELRRYALLAAVAGASALMSYGTIRTCAIVDTINVSGTIRIDQPSALNALLGSPTVEASSHVEQEAESVRTPSAARTGYRVQVYDDNDPRTARRNAEAWHARMQTEFPHIKSYISFNSPYWRVKAGDFRTRAEAEAAMAELRHAFPALGAYLRVIRDRINTPD